ncbi:MAG TPA: hypothetical protein VFJ74_13670 [Gemmatimonadaceae bacterium]|nr:hypothetical protein [Gemmatimonadaceae bacterium]
MKKILAPVALAAFCAAAALTTAPRSALAATASLSDGEAGSCGQGSKVECGSTTTYQCTSWKPQYSVTTTGWTLTYICAASITQTSKSYKD